MEEDNQDNTQESSVPVTEQKSKSKLSPERLEKLACARVKALEKRRQLKDLKDKEKLLLDKQFENRVKVVNEQLNEEQTKPKLERTKPIHKVKKQVALAKQYESTDSESSSDSEPEIVTKPKVKAIKKEYTTSESTSAIAREHLQERLRQENLRNAFNSLFPGHSMQMMM